MIRCLVTRHTTKAPVWPWLIGPYFSAWLKVHGADPTGRAAVKSWLAEVEEHLSEAGLGQVSEIFDGDAPHEARGCMAQAWSVAELLRVAVAVADIDRAVPLSQRRDTRYHYVDIIDLCINNVIV